MKFNAVIAACILSFVVYGQCELAQNGAGSAVNATGHPQHQQQGASLPPPTVSGHPHKKHSKHHQPSGQVKREASGVPPSKPTGKAPGHDDAKHEVAHDSSRIPPPPKPSGKPHGADDKKHHSKRDIGPDASHMPPPPKSTGKPHGNPPGHHDKKHSKREASGTPPPPPPPKPTGSAQPSCKPHGKPPGDDKKDHDKREAPPPPPPSKPTGSAHPSGKPPGDHKKVHDKRQVPPPKSTGTGKAQQPHPSHAPKVGKKSRGGKGRRTGKQ
ncbi:unnamed protein product [Absidia cylindrospora]